MVIVVTPLTICTLPTSIVMFSIASVSTGLVKSVLLFPAVLKTRSHLYIVSVCYDVSVLFQK